MCAFVVLGVVFFIPSQEIGLGNVSRMTYFVLSGTYYLASNQEVHVGMKTLLQRNPPFVN